MKTNILPLDIKNPIKTELPALIALEAIGKPWFSEAHRTELLAIGLVAESLAEQNSEAHLVSYALLSALEPTELDIDIVRPLAVPLITWIQRQPNGRVQAAIDLLLGSLVKIAA